MSPLLPLRLPSRVIVLVALLSSSFPFVRAADEPRKCYFPDGSFARDYNPCSSSTSSTEDVHCCAGKETCISNGLCFGTNKGWVYRGGCTDQTWSSEKCPEHCREVGIDGWANLTPCYEKPNNTWWCNDGLFKKNYCSTNTFFWTTGTVMKSAPTVLTKTDAASTTTTTESSLRTTREGETSTSRTSTGEDEGSSSSSPTPTSSSTSSSTSGGGGNTAIAATTPALNPSVPTGTTTTCPSVSKIQRDASLKTGLGTSIPLVVVSAILAALWLLERRKRMMGGGETQGGVAAGKMDGHGGNGYWYGNGYGAGYDASASAGRAYTEMGSSGSRGEMNGVGLPAEVR